MLSNSAPVHCEHFKIRSKTNFCCCNCWAAPSTSKTLNCAKVLTEAQNNNIQLSISNTAAPAPIHRHILPMSRTINTKAEQIKCRRSSIIYSNTNESLAAKAQAFVVKFMPLIKKSQKKEKLALKISLKKRQKARTRSTLPSIFIASATDDSATESSPTIDDDSAQKTMDKIAENYKTANALHSESILKSQNNKENYYKSTKAEPLILLRDRPFFLEIFKKNNNRSNITTDSSNISQSTKASNDEFLSKAYHSPLLAQPSSGASSLTTPCFEDSSPISLCPFFSSTFRTPSSTGNSIISATSSTTTLTCQTTMNAKLTALGLLGEATTFKKLLSNSLLQVLHFIFVF